MFLSTKLRVVNSFKNHSNENLMCGGKQATNIKRNRDDDDDNPKENKQQERKHMRNLFTQFG
jgi:hypothetical protein